MIPLPIKIGLYRLGWLLACLGLPCGLWAQLQLPEICGSTPDQQGYEQYRKDVQKEPITQLKNAATTTTLKLQPHIIRRTNGTGGLSLSDLSISIQQLNQAFAQVGFVFEDCAPNYIDNDAFFDEIILSDNPNSLEYQMAVPNRVNDAVNVFFVPNGVPSAGSIFQINWSSFPYMEQSINKNWTVMTNSFATDDETLAHEIGHYFNLLHTHFYTAIEGPYSGQNIVQERFTRNSNDPCYNCETAGDLLCDTEGEPSLADLVNSSCQYIGSERDSCLQLYQPNTRNVMSYAIINRQSIGCRTNFTPGQINRMWNALNQLRTNLVSSCSSCPTDVNVTQNVPNGQVRVVTASNRITASNTVSSGGTATYDAGVEVVLTPDFDAQQGANFDAVINGCTAPAALPPAPPNTGMPAASAPSLRLAPNPASGQVTLTVALPAARAIAHLAVVNAQGQEVQRTVELEALDKGTYQVSISTQELPAGLYFVQLLTEQETLTKQLIVVKP